jgi:hypothetical protein
VVWEDRKEDEAWSRIKSRSGRSHAGSVDVQGHLLLSLSVDDEEGKEKKRRPNRYGALGQKREGRKRVQVEKGKGFFLFSLLFYFRNLFLQIDLNPKDKF